MPRPNQGTFSFRQPAGAAINEAIRSSYIATTWLLVRPCCPLDRIRLERLQDVRRWHDFRYTWSDPHITLIPTFEIPLVGLFSVANDDSDSSTSDRATATAAFDEERMEVQLRESLSDLSRRVEAVCRIHSQHRLLVDRVSSFEPLPVRPKELSKHPPKRPPTYPPGPQPKRTNVHLCPGPSRGPCPSTHLNGSEADGSSNDPDSTGAHPRKMRKLEMDPATEGIEKLVELQRGLQACLPPHTKQPLRKHWRRGAMAQQRASMWQFPKAPLFQPHITLGHAYNDADRDMLKQLGEDVLCFDPSDTASCGEGEPESSNDELEGSEDELTVTKDEPESSDGDGPREMHRAKGLLFTVDRVTLMYRPRYRPGPYRVWREFALGGSVEA
ncbi:hypothetical protein ACQY0O_006146 [Thecaphora frezii]